MKYPYIGKWEYINTTVIFTGENAGIEIGGEMSFRDDWTEINYENITHEYLANTYGEVKSKEHAEFIVKLATSHGYTLTGAIKERYARTFVIDGENKLLFFMRGRNSFDESVLKQITIPLPPECDSVDEWPKIGDDAILTNENDYGITHGAEAIGKKVKVMSLFKDGDLDMAAIKHGITNYCFRVDMLQKPKTPEQELRDELIELTLSHVENKEHPIEANAYYLVSEIIEKYIKKPQ